VRARGLTRATFQPGPMEEEDRPPDDPGETEEAVFFFFSHSIQLTPQQQSAESRKIAGAEALAVARRPEEASWDKHLFL